MSSMKSFPSTPVRRVSLPASSNPPKISTGARKISTGAVPTGKQPTASKQQQQQPTEVAAAAATPPTTSPGQISSVNSSQSNYKVPLLLTPVSQLPRESRRLSQSKIPERPAAWDPENYNPDGSLRTVHRMPGFDQSYAQAMQARYIRHRDPLAREKELSVNEIFGKKDNEDQ